MTKGSASTAPKPSRLRTGVPRRWGQHPEMARTTRPGKGPTSGQSLISPQQTNRWNEQAPVRSQARRVQPGQAQS
jgi:hypothetical protein